MMGRRGGADRLFYSFNLDGHLPRDHLLRGIDQVLTSVIYTTISNRLQPHRPTSIDPELMIRMLIVGYSFGIRSSGGCARRRI